MVHPKGLLAIRIAPQILSSISALYLTALSIWLFRQIIAAPYMSLWPLPGGYLLEIMTLSVLAAAISLFDLPKSPILLWFVTGIILAFNFWGEMTIGLFYFPAFLLLFISSILAEIRYKRKFFSDLWAIALGVLGQSALIWLMIWIFGVFPPTITH